MNDTWICDRGGLHWHREDCDCPPDDDTEMEDDK